LLFNYLADLQHLLAAQLSCADMILNNKQPHGAHVSSKVVNQIGKEECHIIRVAELIIFKTSVSLF
jgi:hypothetical protein